MLQRLFSPFGMPEPKSQARRKRLVRLIERLARAGFKIAYRSGRYFA